MQCNIASQGLRKKGQEMSCLRTLYLIFNIQESLIERNLLHQKYIKPIKMWATYLCIKKLLTIFLN